MKNEIGILTHWGVPNFGTFLQAYALANIIKKLKPNADVKQIAYSNDAHTGMYYNLELHQNFKCWMINPKFYLDIARRWKSRNKIYRIRGFKHYYYDYINHTKDLKSSELKKYKFSTVVLGSDILWDYSIRFFGNDKHMFGNGFCCDNIISYAASFGTVKQKSKHPDFVKNGIKGLKAISVRDAVSVDIVNEITGKLPFFALDPTLVWNFVDDPIVKKESVVSQKYVAVYGSFFLDEQINDLIEYCRRNNYKIVYLDSVGDKCEWCDIFVEASTITPFEWCNYIRNSELLMTCTYHGLMFGLVFHKKIFFNATEFMKAKVAGLLDKICLEEVLLRTDDLKSVLTHDWNYEEIDLKISERKKASIEFLKNNIKDDDI